MLVDLQLVVGVAPGEGDATLANELAVLRCHQGRYSEAEEEARTAYEIKRAEEGNTPNTLTIPSLTSRRPQPLALSPGPLPPLAADYVYLPPALPHLPNLISPSQLWPSPPSSAIHAS